MTEPSAAAPPVDFAATRALFDLPEGVVYLDGNSLGPPPRAAAAKVAHVMQAEWGGELIRAWNTAGWFEQPRRVGDRVGRLIGAEPGSVMMGDTLSIKVYQALAAALDLNPGRRVILSDTGNFPTDLYMAEGLLATLEPVPFGSKRSERKGPAQALKSGAIPLRSDDSIRSGNALGRGHVLKLVEPAEVEAHLGDDVAVLMLTEVDYRTGRRHDMARLTARAHAVGALTLWDLAHSAGAFPVDLAGAGADFAAGCTYKYLNGGPGAPAFIYVAPRHADRAVTALSGWMGHARPFAFAPSYAAAGGVERMRVGTPPVLALAALEASLDIWETVDLRAIRARSLALADRFIAEVERRCPVLRLVTPRDPAARGSQVSFAFEGGYAAMQALIARGVIGDFRAPDIMRFGICPIYNGEDDMLAAADAIDAVINGGEWRKPEYAVAKAVT